jgi:predicted GH43/DUF377 family glycosyl hydrolase
MFLRSAAVAAVLAGSEFSSGEATSEKLSLHVWRREAANPIFVPGQIYDSQGCQAPFVVRHTDTYFMFYGGIDKQGRQRVSLATAPVTQAAAGPGAWTRLGPIIELGRVGAFDELSTTYPAVHRVGNKWHLYYTGRSTFRSPQHFSNYRGIGLAVSENLREWKKVSTDPVLTGEGYPGFPDNRSIVGLGRIVELPQADGNVLYRMYHTLTPGLEGQEWNVIEDKYVVVAHSQDGIHWSDKRIVLGRRRDVPYEDIGVVGLTAWRTKGGGWRGVYTGLGTKFKSYSLCEAVSADGLGWHRGPAGQNLSLGPSGQGWEKQMIGYPSVDVTSERIVLFYNGAGGGATGIGMAAATPVF